jgi:hypothetical protein
MNVLLLLAKLACNGPSEDVSEVQTAPRTTKYSGKHNYLLNVNHVITQVLPQEGNFLTRCEVSRASRTSPE